MVAFKQELLNGLKGDDYDFAKVVTKATKQCEETFSTGAKEALVEGTDWNWEDELEVIMEEIRGVADQCRKDETKKMINAIEVRRVSFCWKRISTALTEKCCRGTSRDRSRSLWTCTSTNLCQICGTMY